MIDCCEINFLSITAIQSSSRLSLSVIILDTKSFVQSPISTSSIIVASIHNVTELQIHWDLGTVLNPLNTSGMIQLYYTAAVLEEVTLVLDVSSFVSEVMVARMELTATTVTLNPILVVEETAWVVGHLVSNHDIVFYL